MSTFIDSLDEVMQHQIRGILRSVAEEAARDAELMARERLEKALSRWVVAISSEASVITEKTTLTLKISLSNQALQNKDRMAIVNAILGW